MLIFATVTQTFNTPPGLLSAVCYVESNHRPHAFNENDGGSSSIGICQIKLTTAQGLGFRGTAEELAKPKTNIYYAGKYLKAQLTRYSGDIKKAISAYNAGTHREDALGITKNRRYVAKVFKAWNEDK